MSPLPVTNPLQYLWKNLRRRLSVKGVEVIFKEKILRSMLEMSYTVLIYLQGDKIVSGT